VRAATEWANPSLSAILYLLSLFLVISRMTGGFSKVRIIFRPFSMVGVVVAMLVALVSGCTESAEQKSAGDSRNSGEIAESAASQVEILVPDEVAGQWKAVKIGVHDKSGSREEVFIVDIGSGFKVSDSDVSLRVTNFLPDFIMKGPVMTSASNELNNPAARVEIFEGDQQVYQGWLFSLYPDAHAYQHPRYGFNLLDFIPTRPNKSQ
jgi:hypothetical protein